MNNLIEDLRSIRLAIFDLDGVIYRGGTLITNVDKIIDKLRSISVKVVFNSNNSTATRERYAERLTQLNIPCSKVDFYTSASLTAKEITRLKEGSIVYVIGEIGLRKEIEAEGHKVIFEDFNYEMVDFVIVGLDRDFNYKKIAFAQKCIKQGKAQFYATNPDATLPIEDGDLPGAGVMVKAIETCTGQKPRIIFGKPNPFGIQKILEDTKISSENAYIFGDRLDTDIIAGNRAGIKTVLVLTGVTSKDILAEINADSNTNLKPDLVINNLGEIFLN